MSVEPGSGAPPTALPDSSMHASPLSVSLGRIRADRVTFADAVVRIVARVRTGEGGYVVTPNVDHICLAENDAELRTAYRHSFLALADGAPLLWVSSWMKKPLPEKISGSDLLVPLLEAAAQGGLSVYFLGSNEATCSLAARRLTAQCPGLQIAGWTSPMLNPNGDARELEDALEKVRAARPDLLLVAMGCPKQEYVMWRYQEQYAPAVAVGIGASLDFAAGTLRRSPRWFSDNGLEWLYRLVQEPRRLGHRYLVRDRAIIGVVWRMRRDARRAPGGDASALRRVRTPRD